MGFEEAEAANLSALRNGFAIRSQPWTVSELTHLLFLRESRISGDRWSQANDRVEQTSIPGIAEPTAQADQASASPVGATQRGDADPSDGRLTLLALLRSMAGRSATLDPQHPSARPRPGAAGGIDGEGR